jgi:hypothetical protein
MGQDGRRELAATLALSLLMAAPTFARERPVLSLVWVDVVRLAPSAYPHAAREAADLIARMGVQAVMRQAAYDAVLEERELAVIVLPRHPTSSGRPLVMGATRRGVPTRAVWIYLEGVAGTLGLGPPALWSPVQQREGGRAMARVAVHELVHAVVPALPHAPQGLMAERMSRRLLLSDELALEAATGAAFRAALAWESTPARHAQRF